MILEMTRPVQGALRLDKKFEVISNHLANSDTTGFKADVLSFDNMFRARMNTDFSQGDLRETGNKLDVALKDQGFFKIQTPQGVRYTRDGSFTLNNDGLLVTQNGNPVLGDGGTITIEGQSVFINQAGEIQVDGQTVDTLSVVTFNDLNKLHKQGNSLFVYDGPATDEIAPNNVSVAQGALEKPNIQTVVEMTKMIENLRYYESFHKVIQTFEETDQKAITEVARTV